MDRPLTHPDGGAYTFDLKNIFFNFLINFIRLDYLQLAD